MKVYDENEREYSKEAGLVSITSPYSSSVDVDPYAHGTNRQFGGFRGPIYRRLGNFQVGTNGFWPVFSRVSSTFFREKFSGFGNPV